MSRLWIFALFLSLPFCVQASTLTVGQAVPPIAVVNRGEVLWQHNTLSYRPWCSEQLHGKVRIIMHLAGRLSAKQQTQMLAEALKMAAFPAERYQTTLIVNTGDAIPGSAVFVRASVRSSKESSPRSQFIIDDDGVVKQAWQLNTTDSAVLLVDRQGHLRFVKEGSLTPAEVQKVITLIGSLL